MRAALPVSAALVVAACSGQSGGGPASPTPLPAVVLQARMAAASSALGISAGQAAADRHRYCDAGSTTTDLSSCERALSAERTARLAFDSVLRALDVPAGMAGDLQAVLAADTELEALLEQAATAPSLGVIQLLQSNLGALRGAVEDAATKLRADAGLPPGGAAQ